MSAQTRPDVVLVGAGIMSATLGMLLKQLDPGVTIEIFESLDLVAGESSNAWNNAGTGHAALCELNYTPQREDGSVDISKARSGRPACPDHQEGPCPRRDPAVWHGSGFLGGWVHRGAVGGVARSVHIRFDHASAYPALLQGTCHYGRLAGKTQGDDSVLWGLAGKGFKAVRGGNIPFEPDSSAGRILTPPAKS
jgi:Malate:quinone oxidoreductase (Mqo)